jgi:pyruvate/2-oxoglutarate/acetoin dehydrogenase E1 component
MASPTYLAASREALSVAMSDLSPIIVLGEDVEAGGPFGLTKGLVDSFGPTRIRNTPICEAGFVGVGIGLALSGGRPFIDLMFSDFLTAASDQLFNHAAKIHFMSGGSYSVPLTVWTVAGAGTRWGAQHSQRVDGWLAQVPGLKVLAPSSPALAASSVRAALEDPDPVVIVVDRGLLYSRDSLPNDDGSPWQSRIVRSGNELTVVSSGRLIHLALQVASATACDAEIIDLQRIAPLDLAPIIESVNKTGRLLIAHDESSGGGLSANLHSLVSNACFKALRGPVALINSPATPVPAAPSLEDAFMINADRLGQAFQRALVA